MVYRVAVDIGGTFTDAVSVDDAGRVRTGKTLSTPGRLSDGVLSAVGMLGVPMDEVTAFIHGTTAGLNAFLERRGARVALLTTEGFRDVYEIGRASRPAMYDVRYRPPTPLVARRSVYEIRERLGPDGSVVLALDETRTRDLLADVLGRYDAVAVCLLHAYANPQHERLVAALAHELAPSATIVCSADVAPEWREYERTSTTVLSAYIAPILAAYVEELEQRLAGAGLQVPLQVMQSNGGVMSAAAAKSRPLQTLFSGPVGGTAGGVAVSEDLSHLVDARRLICVDMGGTSFDVSLVVDGAADVEADAVLEGHPVLSPTVAIHTVGAGGGSVGHVAAGGLRVGPRSAGALPGPASYGRGGTEPTVTDANLLLGRLPAVSRLGGDLVLHPGAARAAMDRLADELGMERQQLAEGLISVADTAMANAIREITVKRGIDPRHFALVAFGGAGPLHAVALAEELELRRVIVPRDPGVLSAWGMLQSDTRHDTVMSFYARLDAVTPDAFTGVLNELLERGRLLLKEDGVEPQALAFEPAADLRYAGQEYTVTVPFDVDADPAAVLADLPDDFAAAHKERYGHNNPGEAIEMVNVRVAALGLVTRPPREPVPPGRRPQPLTVQDVVFGARSHPTPIFGRNDLGSDVTLAGPCVLIEDACTVLVPPAWQVTASPHGHLVISRGQ